MPIKWTPEVDQVLLLKILETCNVSADCEAISSVWPENLERPTPRAIRERLTKIRTLSKGANTAGHFSIMKSDKAGNSKPSSTAGTPRKRASNVNGNGNGVKKTMITPSKNGTKANGATKSGKRGRMTDEDAQDDSEPGFKSDHDSEADESPSKNAKIKVEEEVEQGHDASFYDNMSENADAGNAAQLMEDSIYA